MRRDLKPSLKHPQIYAYTTPAYKTRQWTSGSGSGFGVIKIGFTEKLRITDRIDEQFPTKTADKDPYEVLFHTTAIDEMGNVFRDKAVHMRLEEKGFYNPNGEWYECTKDDIVAAITEIKAGKKFTGTKTQSFQLRPEQEHAVEVTSKYFREFPGSNSKPSHFLWNAKMRFGKTFTSYELVREMGWKRIIILTYKPAVATQWKIDLESHVNFDLWEFCGPGELYAPKSNKCVQVVFASFQDILGRNKATKERKARFAAVFDTSWDAAFIDEYHFGAWREGAKELYAADPDRESEVELSKIDDYSIPLDVSNIIYLSGTPFKALANGEFTEDQIFNWTYADEQAAKQDSGDLPGNPYRALPKMCLLTYQLPERLRQVATEGETNEFDLNEFFRATKSEDLSKQSNYDEYKFVHEDDVNQWLGLIRGQLPQGVSVTQHSEPDNTVWPYRTTELQAYLAHTIWFLPSVASCKAMARLLKRPGGFYSNYEVVVAAGNEAGMGEKALEPVERAIGTSPFQTRTITLTCGKLITGVSVKAWTGIFMLRNTSSPETYFQAAFRVQTPWSYPSPDHMDEGIIIKNECYVFDFAPTRALRLIADYSSQLNAKSNENVTKRVEDFLRFLPVLCYDGAGMQELNATELLDVATVGTASSMLARRWQSEYLINVDSFTLQRVLDDPKIMESLKKIEGFRNLANLQSRLVRIVNQEKSLKKVKKNGSVSEPQLTPQEKEEQRQVRKFREELKRDLKKFVTRIPIFMYLTEYREESLQQVITSVEPDLFTKVTGLTVEEFSRLDEVGLFNGAVMNQAVFAFKRFEEPSLNYAGGAQLSEYVGGFDTVIHRDELSKIMDS